MARAELARAHPSAAAEAEVRLPLAAPWPVVTASVGDQQNPNLLRRTGDYWSLTFQDHTVALRDLKGLRYLARLLGHPGREFHVLDLVANEVVPAANPPGRPIRS